MGEISLRIAVVQSNTGETSGSTSLQREKDALMAPNPRENSRVGRISRETSGKLAYVGEISPIIVCVGANTGETSGSSPLQRQKDTLMAPYPRELTGGTHFQREL